MGRTEIPKRHIYGKFLSSPLRKDWLGQKAEEKPVTPEDQDKVDRLGAYYKAEDQSEQIEEGKREKEAAKESGDVPGLCGTCSNLRWIKTRLGHRDRYWCANSNVQRMMPDGILDTGDEITKCPYYSPRPKPTDMTLRDMFNKAVLIDIKEYEPGTDEDSNKRGITYL